MADFERFRITSYNVCYTKLLRDLRDLYQEVILDHNKRPRNFGHAEGATHEADGHNPLCGDKLHVSLVLDRNNFV